MDKQKARNILHRLVFGRGGPEPERKEMTRGQQTAWIIGGIAVVAFFGINYMQYQEDRCTSIFAENPVKCRSDRVVEAMRRY